MGIIIMRIMGLDYGSKTVGVAELSGKDVLTGGYNMQGLQVFLELKERSTYWKAFIKSKK